MNITQVIEQLRANAPVFASRVAGGAAYTEGIESNVWLQTPAAYIVPLEEDTTENLDKAGSGLKQIITERIGVIVQMDNSADRRGQNSAEMIDVFRASVFSALLNWIPDQTRSPKGLYYAGGERLGMDRARFFYQFSFAVQVTYSHLDGYQYPPGVPLTEIAMTLADAFSDEIDVIANVQVQSVLDESFVLNQSVVD